MGRKTCCDEVVNRGTWSVMEDQILANFLRVHGRGKWRDVPKRAGLNRCGKSCRLRWLNYLRPDIKRGNFSEDEEDLIIRLHNLLGNRWSLIAGRLPGRTDNDIKNFWNTNLGKRVHQKNIKNFWNTNLGKSFHQKNYPITMKKTPTTLTSPHHHQRTKFSCPADHPSQPNPVIRPKPVRCTKKIIFPEPNAEELETKNDATASACDIAGDPRNNDRVSSYDFLEDFDVDGLKLKPGEPQVVPEANVNDYEEVNGFENCDGDDNDEANVTDHQNDWTVEKFFGSADHDDEEVDFSSLDLLSDSFMVDFDPSYV